jgi:hypothetical protein
MWDCKMEIRLMARRPIARAPIDFLVALQRRKVPAGGASIQLHLDDFSNANFPDCVVYPIRIVKLVDKNVFHRVAHGILSLIIADLERVIGKPVRDIQNVALFAPG